MSDPKTQQEPTMEEILSSIRRIITEDQDPDGEEAGTPPEAERTVEAEPEDAGDKEAEDLGAYALSEDQVVEPDEPEAEDDSDLDDTVIELTDVVEPEESGTEEHEDGVEEAEPVIPEPEPAIPEPEPEPTIPEPEPVAEAPPAPTPVPEVVAAPEPVMAPAVVPAVEERAAAPQQTTVDPVGAELDFEAALVSQAAAAATSTAFTDLAAGVSQTRGVALGGSGRTLEELIKELLRPMLKEWLDENLPPLVQRLVEREISKLAGRADK